MPDQPFDIMNAQADQLWNSTASRLNTVPNPQLAADALQVGAGTDVASMLDNSDPSSDNSLSALVSGGAVATGDGSFSQPRSAASATGTDPYNYSRDDYRRQQDELMSKDDSLRHTFADVNGVPIANIAYAQDTLYWTGKDSKQAKNWQQHLIDAGIYQGDGTRQHADGTWTPADTQAFYQYMAFMGMPDAINSKDPATKSKATTAVQSFMAQLGRPDWTPDAQASAVGKKPEDQAAFQDVMFNNWLLAHPTKKGDGNALADRINEYADLYGQDSLPQHVRDLGSQGSGGILGKIMNIPSDALGMMGTLDDHLPDWLTGASDQSRKDKAAKLDKEAKQIAAGKPDDENTLTSTFGQTSAERSAMIGAELTPTEQAQFAPVINKVMNGNDYMTEFGNWWGHQTTKIQLATLYAGGDLFSGKDFHSNPFDNMARAWSGGTANEDNFLKALAPQFVKDHPDYANIVNFGASFIDPTVLVGAAGRLATSGRFIKGIELGSGLSKADLMKNGVPVSAIDRLAMVVAPKRSIANLRDAAMPSLIRGAAKTNANEVFKILGADTIEEQKTVLDSFYQDGKFKTSLSDREIQQTLQTHFDHVYDAGATWYNFQHSVAMMQPNLIRKMDANRLMKGLSMGAWDFGHQAMNFNSDMSKAVDKIFHDGKLAGIPIKDLNETIDKIIHDPTGAVDAADQFYQKVIKSLPPGTMEKIQASRTTKWRGQVPDSIVHQYAVDPKGPASVTGTAEVSTAPMKVPPTLKGAFDAIKNATDGIESKLMDEVERYQKSLGFGMGGSKEANAPIVERFLQDPANKAVADKYLKDKADVEREMKDLVGSSTGERGAPMLEQQLAIAYHAPVSTWEIIAATHGTLHKLEQFQKVMQMNRVMDMWKTFTLAKPSSAIRALIGDDSARVAVTLALAGSPKAAAQYTIARHVMSTVTTPFDALKALVSPLGKSVFGVEESLRGVLMTKLRQLGGMTKEEAENASKNWYDKQVEVLGPLAPDMHRLAEQTDHTGGFHPVGPGMPGHAESLPWWIRSLGAGPGKEWARIYDAEGAGAARKFLQDHRLSGTQTDASIRLALAKGATRADVHALQAATEHGATATEYQARLDRADASMPRYLRGPKKGQINYSNKAVYRSVYGSMPKVRSVQDTKNGIDWMKTDIQTLDTEKQTATADRVKEINGEIEARTAKIQELEAHLDRAKKYPNLHSGDFRSRVQARVQYHQDMSQDFPQIILEQARNEHDFYEKIMAMPELRDMVKSGHVNQKALDGLIKNPVTKPKLPWVIATQDTAETRQAIDRIMKKPASMIMDQVFRPMITAGRADGMKRINDWWEQYLTEYYKGSSQWDQARIQKVAAGKAQAWMANNTYQGARTIGSYAMRNVMPFSGSVMNQDKFWLNTFKAHPWAAGVAAKLGIKADEHRNDKWNIPNPLGWAHVGGDQMQINPLGWSFIGSEGMGSFVPGLGPFAMPFAASVAQNPLGKQILDMVPGWSNYLPQDTSLTSIVGSAIPSYIRKGATAAALAGGLPATMIPGAEKDIADRTKIDEAMGQRPTEDQVRREVEIEQAAGAAASWVLPVQPQIDNATLTTIKKASADEANGVPIDQLQKDPKYQSIQPYLEYRNPATDPKRKDQIAAEYPQVLAWAAGTHETLGTTNNPKAATAQEFNQMNTSGDEHFLSAGEIDKEIHDAFQVNQFFQAYDSAYVPVRDKFLADNGVSTSSQEYKDFKATTLDPMMAQIKSHYPMGYDKFISGSKAMSDQTNTQSIASLDAFFHMPTTAELDSKGVTNWRYVTDFMAQTVQNIVDAKSSGASAADLQQISNQFQSALDTQFANDPGFLDEIGLRYHWSSWRDFLTKQANDEIKAQNQ